MSPVQQCYKSTLCIYFVQEISLRHLAIYRLFNTYFRFIGLPTGG